MVALARKRLFVPSIRSLGESALQEPTRVDDMNCSCTCDLGAPEAVETGKDFEHGLRVQVLGRLQEEQARLQWFVSENWTERGAVLSESEGLGRADADSAAGLHVEDGTKHQSFSLLACSLICSAASRNAPSKPSGVGFTSPSPTSSSWASPSSLWSRYSR